MHIHYNDLHSQALTEDPEAYSNEIYNLGSPFLDRYLFILNLSDPCPSVDKKSRKYKCMFTI